MNESNGTSFPFGNQPFGVYIANELPSSRIKSLRR